MKYLPVIGATVAFVCVANAAFAKTPAEIESLASLPEVIAKPSILKMIIAFSDDRQQHRVLERSDLAIALYPIDTKDEAALLAECNRLLALNPREINAYILRGFVKMKKIEGTKSALADFNRAIAIDSKSFGAYLGRGYIKYTRLGNRAGGIADVRRAAKFARAEGNDFVLVLALKQLQSWGVGE